MLRIARGCWCALATAALVSSATAQTVITQWNFNSGNDANTATGTLTPSTGSGTAALFGGITGTFGSGDASGGSTDPNVGDDSAWQTTSYPAQGAGSGAAGVEFAVSTSGFTGIMLSFDQRHSNTSSRFAQVFVSTDGVNFTAFGQPFEAASGGDQWYNARTLDLSSLAAAGNNPNFKFRIAPVFAPGTSQYAASTATSTYAGSGTNRFDMVTVSGTAVQSIPPTGTGGSVPGAVCAGGGQILLTVAVQPGFNPPSSSIGVTVNLTSVGGPAAFPLNDTGAQGDQAAGDNVFSALFTVPGSVGVGNKSVPATITDQVPGRSGAATIAFAVADCSAPSPARVVISQVYGGGGNLGPPAGPYNADFVELYNRSNQVVDLTGWSVQYAGPNATGGFDGPDDRALLSGVINPGQHLLVRFSEPGTSGTPLPPADCAAPVGGMGNNSGRVALVRAPGLIGTNCGDANIEDFVGYGGASCFEGAAATAPLANDLAAVRRSAGTQDTNQNFNDFLVAAPSPSNRAAGGFLAGYGSVDQPLVCAGSTVVFTVNVSPAATPASTGLAVSADLSSVGGPALASFAASGGNVFTLTYAVPASVSQGAKSVPVTVRDAQGRADSSAIALTVGSCTPASSRVVISQVYGGGGNVGSVFNADFIELYNRSGSPVDMTGWSVQYADAAANFLASRTIALSGTIPAGGFRLVQANAASAVNGLPIPAPDFTPAAPFGMDNQTGKVALVRSAAALGASCTDPNIEDLVGYGRGTGCFEGVAPTATLDNATVALRKDGGCRDTNQTGLDFDVLSPTDLPRSSATTPSPCAVSASGACCSGATCSVAVQGACTGANTRYAGNNTACNAPGNSTSPCCKADYNQNGSVTVQDIFDFLAGYFSSSPQADINASGAVTVQDIFDFLAAYFTGCAA